MMTVQAAAVALERPVLTINYWRRTHDIGTLATPRLRSSPTCAVRPDWSA